VFAQEAKKEPPMDPAMMEAMMKAATPGEGQKKLDAFVGTWDTKISFWMAPGTDAMVHSGTSKNRWILGGRALEQSFSGSMMGAPFEGIGYTGYVCFEWEKAWLPNLAEPDDVLPHAIEQLRQWTKPQLEEEDPKAESDAAPAAAH
jgi:hypothetical protein